MLDDMRASNVLLEFVAPEDIGLDRDRVNDYSCVHAGMGLFLVYTRFRKFGYKLNKKNVTYLRFSKCVKKYTFG
jgi:hypothetical protein